MRLLRSLILSVALAAFSAAAVADETEGAFGQARELVRRGQFPAAIALLEKCVAAQPGSSSYHHWLGRAIGLQAAQSGMTAGLASVGKIKGYLEKAIALDPANVEARQDLVILYRAVPGFLGGSATKADEQLAEIRRRDPSLASQIEGDLLAGEKKPAEAEAAYYKSAQANRSRPMPHVRLALLHQRAKDWDKAFLALDRALKIDGKFPAALYQVGRTAAFSGQQLERGEAALRLYLTMPVRGDLENPPLSGAHFRLGNILEKKRNPMGARAEYETALQLDPKNKEARAALEQLKR